MAERLPSPPPAVFKNLGVAYQVFERHSARRAGRNGASVATLSLRWRRQTILTLPKIRQVIEDTERTLATARTR